MIQCSLNTLPILTAPNNTDTCEIKDNPKITDMVCSLSSLVFKSQKNTIVIRTSTQTSCF